MPFDVKATGIISWGYSCLEIIQTAVTSFLGYFHVQCYLRGSDVENVEYLSNRFYPLFNLWSKPLFHIISSELSLT